MQNPKIVALANEILETLQKHPSGLPRAQEVKNHVQALAKLFAREDTSPETPDAIQRVRFPARPVTSPPITRGLTPRPSDPHLMNERRQIRQNAGVTLKEVARAAGCSLPTAKLYEVKRTAITKPDKRRALDEVYAAMKKD